MRSMHSVPPGPDRPWVAIKVMSITLGGAYYFSTLGAAQLCYLAACRVASVKAQSVGAAR